MTGSPRMRMLLPLLALGATLAIATSVRADDMSIQINFNTSPHWVGVHGTKVKEIRDSERPDYDMFCYGGRYYAFQNDHWYMSRRPRGRFVVVEDRALPRELRKVPSEHWRHYPQGWANNDRHDGDDKGRGHDKDDHGHGGDEHH